jgi:hypothetical protein
VADEGAETFLGGRNYTEIPYTNVRIYISQKKCGYTGFGYGVGSAKPVNKISSKFIKFTIFGMERETFILAETFGQI